MSNGGASCVADVDRKVEEVVVFSVIVIDMFMSLMVGFRSCTDVVDVSRRRS